ncbi:MAG: VC0807 family protein [Bacteroidota bacterium]
MKNIFNKRFLLDLIMYLGIPLLIWNTCRSLMGDYLAMLLSTVPGIIYTVYTVIKERHVSLTGSFILATAIIGGILDVYSKSANQMLYNMIYMNTGLVLFWIFTMLIKKPMAMFFFIDYAYLQGVPKAHSRVLYKQNPLFKYFFYLTTFLVFRDLSDIFLRLLLINVYGVDGFSKIKIITQVWDTIMTVLFVYGIIFIIKKIPKVSII